MQNPFQKLPAIPILVLIILIAVWIVPPLIRNFKNFDWTGGPKTVDQLRRSFYSTLFLTGGWAIIFLLSISRRSAFELGMKLLIVTLGIFMSIKRFRLWRYPGANADFSDKPR